jgi:hypothetical protein
MKLFIFYKSSSTLNLARIIHSLLELFLHHPFDGSNEARARRGGSFVNMV